MVLHPALHLRQRKNFIQAIIKEISSTKQLYMFGDFNARVGTDWDFWPQSIGHFGVGRMNENGQRLLELCSYPDLSIINTFFSTMPNHRVSWRHSRSHHWHLIITRRASLNCVLITRSYHSADCDTDHSLVCSKVHQTKTDPPIEAERTPTNQYSKNKNPISV